MIRSLLSRSFFSRKDALASALAICVKILSALLSALMFASLAQSMKVSEYGIFGLFFSMCMFLATVLSFGQRTFLIKYCSLDFANAQYGIFRATVFRSSVLVICLFFIFIFFFAVFSNFFGIRREFFLPLILLTFAFIISELNSSWIRATKHVLVAIVPRDVFWRSLIIFLVLVCTWYQFSVFGDASRALLICAFTLFFVILLQWLWIGIKLYSGMKEVVRRESRPISRNWIQASLNFWGASVVRDGAPHLYITLVGFTLSPAETAAFFVAHKIVALTGIVLLAFSIVLGPNVSFLYLSSQKSRLAPLFRIASLFCSAYSSIVFLLIAFFSAELMGIFGEAYKTEYLVLIAFSVGYLLRGLCGIGGTAMELVGLENEYFRVVSLSVVITSLLIIPIAQAFGAVGAALCVSLVLGLTHMRICALLFARTGLRSSALSLFH